MRSLVSRSLAACLLLTALVAPAYAEESNRGIYEGSLTGSGRIVFFVMGNSAVSTFVFDNATGQTSYGNGAISSASAFSFNLANGTALSGNVTRNTITASYRGQNVTASRINAFGRCDTISGLFTGTATSTAGTLTNANFLIDAQGNLFFLAVQSGNVIGGVGTITIRHTSGDDDASIQPNDGDDDHGRGRTFSGTFTITLTNGTTVNGTFNFNRGAFTAVFTLNGVQYTFTAGRESLDNRLAAISTRGFVSTGDGVLIGGFMITGGPKLVLIRAIGPSLSARGVSPVLANPKLQLFQGSNLLRTNDDWQTNTNAADITATGLAPGNANESALLLRLEPGAYTTIVSGADGGTGVALVDIYEADRD